MKKQADRPARQLNNQGFSLLEVLVAIIILCIVSIPLLRAFVTAAKTNARARITLRSTSVAEDLMEDFRDLTLDDLDTKYGSTLDESTGIYTYTITDASKFSQKMPDGYYAKLTLDPTKYSNANALNLSDFSTVSARDSAVFTMLEDYDNQAYDEFVKINEKWNDKNNALYFKKESDFFKDNLIRTIKVTIENPGTDTNALGEEIPLVKVILKITYELKNCTNVMPPSEAKYVLTDTEIFNNTVSKTKLNSIFVLYSPRYIAAKNVKGDNIVIENPHNVKANLYVIAQNTGVDAAQASAYNETNGLILRVLEDTSAGSTEAALTLRTNLCDTAPYTGKELEVADVHCKLSYENLTGTWKMSGTNAQKCLNAGDTSGKALDSSQTSVRIYRVTTTIYDNNGDEVLRLDGTRLN